MAGTVGKKTKRVSGTVSGAPGGKLSGNGKVDGSSGSGGGGLTR